MTPPPPPRPCVKIAVATNRGLRPQAALAMLRMTAGLARLGINYGYDQEAIGGLTVARSILAGRTQADPRYDGMLFVDDDVCGYTAEDVARIVTSGEDVVGAPLPQRTVHPDTVVAAVLAGVRGEELLRFLSPLMVVLERDRPANVRGSLLEVRRIGTGFLWISRHALDRVVTELPHTVVHLETQPALPVPMVFDYGVDEENNRQLIGEDYVFCSKWKELGGTVWADTQTELGHEGEQVFASQSLGKTYGIDKARALARATDPAFDAAQRAADRGDPFVLAARAARGDR
jgi:hypothetical protein